MPFLATPGVAMAFGAFMLCAETCLHVESIRSFHLLDWPIHDWTAGIFLVAAGFVDRRVAPASRPFQAAAWEFMLSLLIGAFFAHVEDWNAPQSLAGEEWLSPRVLIVAIAALVVTASGALVSTLSVRGR